MSRTIALRLCLGLALLSLVFVPQGWAQSPPAARAPLNDADRFWDGRFGTPGLESNGYIRTTAVAPNGDIYVGGTFTRIDGVEANNIARWDGTSWHALGNPPTREAFGIFAMAFLGNDLYVGGQFTSIGGIAANNLARWDGAVWSGLNGGAIPGPYSLVYALAVQGSNLYVGGQFTSIGGVAITNLARWDGSAWTSPGTPNGIVRELAIQGADLYASGYFTTIDGVAANHIARWNGSNWSALGSGLNTDAIEMAVDGAKLYVMSPLLTSAGGVPVKQLARWDGTSWSGFGDGIVSGSVNAIAVSNNQLYVGGSFSTAAAEPTRALARWNGTAWSFPAPEKLRSVDTLQAGPAGVYLSGYTWQAPNISDRGLLYLHDGTLDLLGNPTSPAYIGAMRVHDGALYATGPVDHVEGAGGENVMRWDGAGWTSVISDFNLLIDDFEFDSQGRLFAGGFGPTTSDLNGVARWDGAAWQKLGDGITASPLRKRAETLAISGTNVYIGGDFSQVDHKDIKGVARWDGTAWSGFGIQSVYAPVTDLEFFQGDLYAGGTFVAGGTTIERLGRWNGSGWTQIGNLTGRITAMATSASGLYMAVNIGGTTSIHRWDGANLTALGGAIAGTVYAIHLDAGTLYIGGDFSSIGGAPVASIARWDGAGWQALGSGVDGRIHSLASDAAGLYVGGTFRSAGAKPAYSFSIWHKPVALTVATLGTGQGTVSSNPAGVACGADCTEDYPSGAVVTLTATPAAGSVFAGWSGACAGTSGPVCSVTLNEARTVTAIFTNMYRVFMPYVAR